MDAFRTAPIDPVTGLPTRAALLAFLGSAAAPFHLVLVQVEGDPHGQRAAAHLAATLRGHGCLYRVDGSLFAVVIPGTLGAGGHCFDRALRASVPNGLVLLTAIGAWFGGLRPIDAVRQAYEELTRANPRLAPPPARLPSPPHGLPALRPASARPSETEEQLEIFRSGRELGADMGI